MTHMYMWLYFTKMIMCNDPYVHMSYGVATISRLLIIIGLFRKRAL